MTDFNLSETEALIRDTARSWFQGAGDNATVVALERTATGYDDVRWKEFVALGWNGLLLPETVGGGGGTLADITVLAGEVGRAAYPSPLLQTAGYAGTLLALLGEPEKTAALSEQIIGAGAAAVAIVPPSRGGLELRATDGGYVATSVQLPIEWAHVAEVFIGLAPIEGTSRWQLFALPADRSGLTATMENSSDNERIGIVSLRDVLIESGDMLSNEIDAEHAERALDQIRLVRAAELLGGMERVLEMTVKYMKERHQFGKPLGALQSVRHTLADMAINVDAARLTLFEAVSLVLEGREAASATAVAAFVASRSATRVTTAAAQLHGGIGATVEYPLHRYFRRAKTGALRIGSETSQLLRVANTTLEHPGGGLF